VNNRKRNFSDTRLRKAISAIDEKIGAYLASLDEQDRTETPSAVTAKLKAEELQEKIETLQERKEKYRRLKVELAESGEKQISLTDADARSMINHHKGTDVCYNVQTAVDAKHKLIVEHETTNDPTDHAHLAEMALRAKETLEVEQLEVVADMGYYDGAEVKQCADAGITTYVAKPLTSVNKKRGLFTKEDFNYDEVKDCYRCPQGEELNLRFETVELNRQIRYYATAKCRDCPIKEKCTSNKAGRRITRWIDEQLLEEMARRVRARPDMMKQRQRIVEHPFGTIKRAMNQGYFLTRGLKKVGAEMSLTVLSYNIKRAVNIIGVKKMIEAVT